MANDFLQPSEDSPETQPENPPASSSASHEETPAWLKKELGGDPTEERREDAHPASNEQVYAAPEQSVSSEEEVIRLRAELASQQRQLNAMSSRLSSYRAEQSSTPRERGGCLTAFLLVIGILNVALLLLELFGIGSTGLLGVLLLAVRVVALVGIVNTWLLKKSGYYTLLAIYAIGIVLSLFELVVPGNTASVLGSIIGSLIGLGILYLLVHDRWEVFE